MSNKEQLISMGFEPDRIDWALRATKNAGLQQAMDHILDNSARDVPEAADDAPEEPADGAEAKSIKCSECGKVFRSSATASFHAEKSGHQEFEESTEEIKPLTEEEKKAKLDDLRAKLAEKRAAASKEDEKAQRANEAIRRKAGQDTGRLKEEMKIKEAQKDVERKKQEKLEDARARAAIKAQIESDKRERAAKAAAEKAAREGVAQPTAAAPAAPARPAANIKSSENPETRLQIRLHVGGAPLVKTFPSESKALVDVAEFVASQNLAYSVDTVNFATTFPRKSYSRDEMRKSLKDNGLTPSAVLMASV
ncbi:UBX domain-containing protein 1 [Vanrija pseudolonga]|uniref:UBX domain-containing protein 1 n=1 Tax=Vanrija pseudolonga TaxID=143232 RepID=A0AAF1BLS7_9TREE|nr:UBX domain-containing protein 1 [Vanrija pseudolonga]